MLTRLVDSHLINANEAHRMQRLTYDELIEQYNELLGINQCRHELNEGAAATNEPVETKKAEKQPKGKQPNQQVLDIEAESDVGDIEMQEFLFNTLSKTARRKKATLASNSAPQEESQENTAKDKQRVDEVASYDVNKMVNEHKRMEIEVSEPTAEVNPPAPSPYRADHVSNPVPDKMDIDKDEKLEEAFRAAEKALRKARLRLTRAQAQ